jgi:hypothetical protein
MISTDNLTFDILERLSKSRPDLKLTGHFARGTGGVDVDAVVRALDAVILQSALEPKSVDDAMVERIIDAVMGADRYAPKIVPMGPETVVITPHMLNAGTDQITSLVMDADDKKDLAVKVFRAMMLARTSGVTLGAAPDPRPADCRFRLQDEGKAYCAWLEIDAIARATGAS